MWYTSAVQAAVDIGLLDVLLPFVLVFVLSYAVLQHTHVFGSEKGKPKKNINALVAFVFGFFAVIVTSVTGLVQVIATNLGLSVIIGLCFALVIVMIGGKSVGPLIGGTVLFIFAALTLTAFVRAGGFAWWIAIAAVLAFAAGVAIYLLRTKEETEEEKKAKKEAEKQKGVDKGKKGAPAAEPTDEDIRTAARESGLSPEELMKAQEAAQEAAEKAAKQELMKRLKKK